MENKVTELHLKLHQSIFRSKSTKSIIKSGLYEVWFTMFSNPATGEGFWIRYTILIPQQPSNDNFQGDGMLWFGYTNKADSPKNFMIKKRYDITEVQSTNDKHIIQIHNSILTLDTLNGQFSVSNGASVSWDLLLSDFQEPFISTPPISKKLGITNNLNFATHPNVKISGIVTINDKEIQINGLRGIQYHTFGDGYKVPWEWFSAFNFPHSDKAYMDFGYKVNKGILEYFNGVKSITKWNRSTLRKLLTSKKIIRDYSPTKLSFTIKKGKTKISGSVRADSPNFLGVEYRGPQNETFYCYNTSIATLDLVVEINGSKEEYVVKDNVAFETVYTKPLEGYSYLAWDDEFMI